MAFSTDTSAGPVANINVTPLVDVMLVLLIIFMVTAPMMQQGVEVNLPKATTAPLKGDTEQLVLSLAKNGDIFLGKGNQLQVETMAVKVKEIMKLRPAQEQKIYIQADKDLPYGEIMSVMGELHRGGVTQIGLITDPKQPGLKDAANSSEKKRTDKAEKSGEIENESSTNSAK